MPGSWESPHQRRGDDAVCVTRMTDTPWNTTSETVHLLMQYACTAMQYEVPDPTLTDLAKHVLSSQKH